MQFRPKDLFVWIQSQSGSPGWEQPTAEPGGVSQPQAPMAAPGAAGGGVMTDKPTTEAFVCSCGRICSHVGEHIFCDECLDARTDRAIAAEQAAFKAGAEEMREACAQAVSDHDYFDNKRASEVWTKPLAQMIRSLPLPGKEA